MREWLALLAVCVLVWPAVHAANPTSHTVATNDQAALEAVLAGIGLSVTTTVRGSRVSTVCFDAPVYWDRGAHSTDVYGFGLSAARVSG